MLPIVLTLLFALYILGPDLLSKFILGFTIPRRQVLLTRSEEVSRAIVWAAASGIPAVFWALWYGPLRRLWSFADLRVTYAGLYSEFYFRNNQALWFESVRSVMWVNLALLWRIYAIASLISIILTIATHNYSWLRKRLTIAPFLRNLLASIVLPRVAAWHVLLSSILLYGDDLSIHLDVLTKTDGLYQGRLAEKVLGKDGDLSTLTLAEPKRFRREEYIEEKRAGRSPIAAKYWKPIPTNMFLIMGSEIQTINIRYVPDAAATLRSKDAPDDLDKILKSLRVAVLTAESAKRKSKI